MTGPGAGSSPGPIFPIRAVVLGALVPSIIFEIGVGAMVPIIVSSATSLGATLGVAALIAALIPVGQIITDLPAGALSARFGDRTALLGAGLGAAVFFTVGFLATQPWMLGVSVLGVGGCAAVFMIARHAYLTEITPPMNRARVMSTLGGVHRIGLFIGPFVGAAATTLFSTQAVFLVGALTSLIAITVVALALPAPVRDQSGTTVTPSGGLSLWQVIKDNRSTLLSLGVAATGVAAVRRLREVVLPLWAEHLEIDPASVSVIFGLSAGIDMLLFYPAGRVMDRFGRRFIAIPGVVGMALGIGLTPFTSTVTHLGMVAVLLGFANGMTAGLLMTLAADSAPRVGAPQFLSAFRFQTDLGSAAGPLVLTAGSAVGLLAASIWVMAAVGLASVFMLGRTVRRIDRELGH